MPRRAKPPRPYRVKITRYANAAGERCKKTDPGAIPHISESDSYYADLPNAPRTPLGTRNEAEAWKILADKLRAAGEAEAGIPVDDVTRHAKAGITEHIEEWGRVLTAKGTSPEQVGLAANRLVRLAGLAGWKRLPQITADSAILALARVQAQIADGGLGKSAQTRNYYLGHLKAFAAWAHDGGRLKANPIRGLKPVNAETDRRHLRRVPTADEVAELCRWLGTDAAPTRRGLTPLARRLGYQLSMATGFRAGELRRLTAAAFDLDAGSVTCPAAYSKRRRRDTQQLPAWLVEELRAWFAEGHGWDWGRLNKAGPGKLLNADLRDCRGAWVADEGEDATERNRRLNADFLRYRVQTPDGPRFWDYHSFRHAYCTFMAGLPGMDLKTLLSLTRHSTPELALKVYARADEQRIRAAVDQLPQSSEPRPKPPP